MPIFRRTLVLVAVLCTPLPAFAGGGGGFGYLSVGGSTSVEGYGYGILDNGLMIGGFGQGFFPAGVMKVKNGDVTGTFGGYGGMLQGYSRTFGPFNLMALLKVGLGGIATVVSPTVTNDTGFAMMGSLSGEASYLMFPWFKIGAEGGVRGTLTVGTSTPGLTPSVAPYYGIKFTWGWFAD